MMRCLTSWTLLSSSSPWSGFYWEKLPSPLLSLRLRLRAGCRSPGWLGRSGTSLSQVARIHELHGPSTHSYSPQISLRVCGMCWFVFKFDERAICFLIINNVLIYTCYNVLHNMSKRYSQSHQSQKYSQSQVETQFKLNFNFKLKSNLPLLTSSKSLIRIRV